MSLKLVLGANGFIGSHLVEGLAKNNKVRAFVRNEEESIQFSHSDNVDIFRGNFLNENDVNKALDGVDEVYHFISSSSPSSSSPYEEVINNFIPTIRLLDMCVHKSIDRIVYASSGGAVYGNCENGVKLTESDKTNPLSPYAINKDTIDKYLEYYYRNNNLKYLSLRITNPYGGRQQHKRGQGVIPLYMHNAVLGLDLPVYGSGEAIRDYIHIDDLVDIVVKLSSFTEEVGIFNISSSERVSTNELIKIIDSIVDKQVNIEKIHADDNKIVKNVNLDNSKLLNLIGDYSFISLKDGLTRMYERMVKE